MQSRHRFFCSSLVVLALAACGGDAGNGGAVTYQRDVRPLIEDRCGSCHVAGGIAPFALTTYEQVVAYQGAIQAAVVARTMPPWPPDDKCAQYEENRSLSDAQIDTIVKWVGAGAPAGDVSDYKAPAARMGGLSRVDANLKMPVEYTPRVRPDDYRCFIVDWPATTTKYVTGFRANPGNAKIVHHVIAFLAGPSEVAAAQKKDDAEEGPGYTCFGGSGIGNRTAWLGGWAPGSLGQDFPAGTGLRVEPGSKVILQVHYNTLATSPEPDRTSVDVRIDDKVEKVAVIMPWTNPQWLSGTAMKIPAGAPDTKHTFAYDPTPFMSQISAGAIPSGQPIRLWSASLHMHTLGTTARTDIMKSDGTKECMLDIPRWDFHWQGSYGFTQPKTLRPGDKIYLECHWDNTAQNQQVVNGQRLPPQEVYWGEGTTDEMCLGGYYVTQ